LIMVIVMGAALLGWAAFDLNTQAGHGNTPAVQAMADADREVAAYQTFLMAASVVMERAPFTTSTVETRTWDNIRLSAHSPTFVRTVDMPANWVVRGNNTGWVACAPMSEHAIRRLSGYVPSSVGSNRLSTVNQSGNKFVIMGENDAARQAQLTAWCSL
jgi:hypothetical protein